MSSREGDGLLSPFFLLYSILTTLRVRYTALQGTDMEVASFFGLILLLIILKKRGVSWRSGSFKDCSEGG